jgi:hypothetical protein
MKQSPLLGLPSAGRAAGDSALTALSGSGLFSHTHMRNQNGAPIARLKARRHSRGAQTPPAQTRVTETARTAPDELPTIGQLIANELRRLKLTAEAHR